MDGSLVLQDLPDQPFTNLWRHTKLSATNVFGILSTSTAYQTEMLGRMLSEANWVVRQLSLDSQRELQLKDLTESFVVPPKFGFRGYIARDDLGLQFDQEGKLKYFFSSSTNGTSFESGSVDFYEHMARRPMLVDSNSVVDLAIGWLNALQINVDTLKTNTHLEVRRYNFTQGRPSHLWWVTWSRSGGIENPCIVVVVDGTNKKPVRIILDESSRSMRPGIQIANADVLMRMHDVSPQLHRFKPHLRSVYSTEGCFVGEEVA
jgi:hypothetical protein